MEVRQDQAQSRNLEQLRGDLRLTMNSREISDSQITTVIPTKFFFKLQIKCLKVLVENQVFFFKAAVRSSWAVSRTRAVESRETEMLLLAPLAGLLGCRK